MHTERIDAVLSTVSELDVYFDFSKRAGPMIEQVASFIRESGPVIEGLQALADVTATKLPKASEQLGRVNLASERASTDILYTVDGMIAEIGAARTASPTGAALPIHDTAEGVGRILDELAKTQGADEHFRKLMNIWDLHRQSLSAAVPKGPQSDLLDRLNDSCTTIMLSLQVQDITGQQIASVIGLLQAVDDVLRKLLAHVNATVQEQPTPAVVEVSSEPEVGATERQRMVDALLLKAKRNTMDPHVSTVQERVS